MPTIDAVASGNLTNYAVTFGGLIPQSGDTIRAGNFIVDLNASISGIRFETGPSGTGFFRIRQTEINGAGGSLTFTDCDFVAAFGVTAALQCSHDSGTVTIRDAIVANSTTAAVAVTNSGGGTLTGRNATVTLNTQQQNGVRNSGSGVVNWTNASGGNFNFSNGVTNSGNGTVNVVNAYSGTGFRTEGAFNNGAGTINVTNAFGGTTPGASTDNAAVTNAGSGTVNVTNAYAGNLGVEPASRNTGSGFLYVENAYANNFGPSGGTSIQSFAVTGSNAVTTTRTFVRKFFCGPFGALPVSGAVLIQSASDNVFQFRTSPNGPTKTLVDSSLSNQVPAAADVRAGVVYQFGDRTGTLAVPAANQVAVGVPVGSTVGTAVITAANLSTLATQQTLLEVKTKTDTIGTVDLTPVTEQLDDIETTLGDIQAKTDTIEPPSTGPHRLTITATDDGDQLAGALVRILGVAGTLRTTESDAPSLLDLGPGTYTIRITPPALFDAPADIPVTLPGPLGDVSIAIPLTRAAIIPPAAGNLCAVAIRIANPSDTPVASATVRAYLVTGPLLVDTIHAGKTTDTTNANGLATLHLLRSQTYDLEAQIGDTLVTIRRTIPNAPNAVLSATVPA